MRAFALGLLLAACSGSPAHESSDGQPSDAGSGGSVTEGVGTAGVAGKLAVSSAGEGGVAGSDDPAGGAAGERNDGLGGALVAGGTAGSPSSAGTGGVSSSGSGGAMTIGMSGSSGATQGGDGGSTSDPLAPFPAPGCDDWTAYRIPKGKFLAVTGHFDVNGLKNGQCMPISGANLDQTCDAAGNVSQCVCTVTSPPSCGQYCDGDYLVVVLKAEPGKSFTAQLMDGDGHCVNGLPVAK